MLFDEMFRHEHELGLGPFNVWICMAQREWGRANHPKRSLFCPDRTQMLNL